MILLTCATTTTEDAFAFFSANDRKTASRASSNVISRIGGVAGLVGSATARFESCVTGLVGGVVEGAVVAGVVAVGGAGSSVVTSAVAAGVDAGAVADAVGS